MKTGIELIAEERTRQVEAEGWTPEHDDGHDAGQIASAASAYTLLACELVYPEKYRTLEQAFTHHRNSAWPWDFEWWKPSSDPLRNLVKAGALIAAEIDRLQRASTGKDK